MRLTLVPETLASVGHRFTFLGPNKDIECAACPHQKMCFDLEPGHTYQVTKLRPVAHPCELHDEGKARVVEVEPVGFTTSLETKHLRGTAATWTPPDCRMPECANWAVCHKSGPEHGVRYAIESVEDALECPIGLDLKRVRLQRT